MRVCACRRKRVYVVAAAAAATAAANSLAFPTSCSFPRRGETLQSKEHPSVRPQACPLACPPACHGLPALTSFTPIQQHPLQEGGTLHRHVCAPFCGWRASNELRRRRGSPSLLFSPLCPHDKLPFSPHSYHWCCGSFCFLSWLFFYLQNQLRIKWTLDGLLKAV